MTDFSNVPVHVSTGFTWTSLFTGVSSVSILAVIGILLRQIGPWKKQTTDATESLIVVLNERLDKVEATLVLERRLHYIQVAKIEARNAAQRSLDRHKFNNSEACLDALLIRLEAGLPVTEAVRLVQEMRIRHRESERNESAQIHAAEIAATTQAEKELDEYELQLAREKLK